MFRFEKIYNLENRSFIVFNNLGNFPVNSIMFSSCESNNMINGALLGEGISSGRFLGRFITRDQIELIYQWVDNSSLLVFSGKLWGFVCGDPSDKLQMFLNWYCMCGKQGFGAMSCKELKG